MQHATAIRRQSEHASAADSILAARLMGGRARVVRPRTPSLYVCPREVKFAGSEADFANERGLFCEAHFCALPAHYLRIERALSAHFLHVIECSRMQAAS